MTTTLLSPISTVAVAAATCPFGVKERFAPKGKWGSVWICSTCQEFRSRFTEGQGLVEQGNAIMRPRRLCCYGISNEALDRAIYSEIAGHNSWLPTTIHDLYSLLMLQGRGQDGIMANNSYSNVFFVRDQHTRISVVSADWCTDGWKISSADIGGRVPWSGHYHRFFNRIAA